MVLMAGGRSGEARSYKNEDASISSIGDPQIHPPGKRHMSREEDKQAAYAHYVKSWNSLGTNDFSDALREIEQAIALRPENALYHFAKGNVHCKSGAYRAAEDSYKHAHGLRQQWTDPLRALGGMAYDRNLFDEAKRWYEAVVKIEPQVDALTLLANIYLNEDPELAWMHASHALTLDPTWEEAIALRDEALEKVRRSRK